MRSSTPPWLLHCVVSACLLFAARAELVIDSSVAETPCRGDGVPGTLCYVASSTFPRKCECVLNACPPGSVSETTNCFICDRGGYRAVRPSCQGSPTHSCRQTAAALHCEGLHGPCRP